MYMYVCMRVLVRVHDTFWVVDDPIKTVLISSHWSRQHLQGVNQFFERHSLANFAQREETNRRNCITSRTNNAGKTLSFKSEEEEEEEEEEEKRKGKERGVESSWSFRGAWWGESKYKGSTNNCTQISNTCNYVVEYREPIKGQRKSCAAVQYSISNGLTRSSRLDS